MHVFDIIIAVIAAVFLFSGIRRGLIGEVVRLVAMVVGCAAAFLYYRELVAATPIHRLSVPLAIKNGISFFIIFTVCLLAIIAAGWLIRKVIHLTPLVWVDRLTGAFIGLLKTLIIAYVACLSISSLPAKRIKADFGRSVVYKTFSQLPKEMSLRFLLHKRTELRGLFTASGRPDLDSLQHKFTEFKAAVDSVKKIPAGKE